MNRFRSLLLASVAGVALSVSVAGGQSYASTGPAYSAAKPVPAFDIFAGPRKAIAWAATVFTNAGAAIITNRIIQAGTAPKNIGWGTGTTTAAVSQTALVTEAAPTTGGGRTVGTESRSTVTNTNDNYVVTGTVTAGGSLAITEAGLFDAVSAGNMLIRSDFSAINVVSGDSIAFTFGLKMVPG